MEFNQSTQPLIFLDAGDVSDQQPPYLSNAGLRIVQVINHVLLSGSVCLFGIVANIINIIIFAMQGLGSTMNISFFAIAISDLCSLVTLEWLNINLNPFMEDADLPYEPSEIQYLTGGWPHACFARITCWITVYVTAERCLCIALPFKVKQIITPKRTRIVICCIYFFMFLTLLPEYVTLYFGEKFNPKKNKTLVGLLNTKYRHDLEGFAFIFYATLGFISFFLVILFTCILVIKLRQSTKWRATSTRDSGQFEAVSARDKRIMKMVILISSILIICFSPAITLYITVFIEPEFDLIGNYANVFHATWSVAFLAEAINSSVNIFLYYNMGSKYRETFHQLFSRCIKRPADTPSLNKSSTMRTGGVNSISTSLSDMGDKSKHSSVDNINIPN